MDLHYFIEFSVNNFSFYIMANNLKFAFMACALACGAMFTACSDEAPKNGGDDNYNGNLLIKSPDMIAYSSDVVLNKYGSRVGEGEGTGEAEKVEEYVSHNDVEINLTLNDENTEPGVTEEGETFNQDYISSHLSIHVRTVCDVKVRIPVGVEYYCDADDMAIVKKHLEDHYAYGDQNHTLSFVIDGNKVTVNVDYDEEGFTITTAGINEDVINYLAEDYKDGLTFEIWNYFNTEVTRADLKDMMNGATVEFLENDENVDYYVNAFNELRTVEEGVETGRVANQWDCNVSIVESQAEHFTGIEPGSDEYLDGFHGYNGSNLNKVFKNNSLDEDEGEEGQDTGDE